MKLNKEQTFRIPGEVLFQEVSGETVLLDLASESTADGKRGPAQRIRFSGVTAARDLKEISAFA